MAISNYLQLQLNDYVKTLRGPHVLVLDAPQVPCEAGDHACRLLRSCNHSGRKVYMNITKSYIRLEADNINSIYLAKLHLFENTNNNHYRCLVFHMEQDLLFTSNEYISVMIINAFKKQLQALKETELTKTLY
jgi:hypothetical protein